ncbi:VOC family protein [Lachnoclostridium edouardi]|uniref:VOC family protein n=1 Tax=Lachnoclostridium edouardi TaxID=1926283 RepID=UPI000C7DE712|nr:hypothetical protein [Lachnoclostridium edouardi]
MKPEFTMQHIGINGKDRQEAVEIVTLFSSIFDLELRTEKKGSPFAGACIEAMAGNGPGTHGHIAFYPPDMEAAIKYLEDKGVPVNHGSAKRNEDGSIYVIYLQNEIAGFAIQLINK